MYLELILGIKLKFYSETGLGFDIEDVQQWTQNAFLNERLCLDLSEPTELA